MSDFFSQYEFLQNDLITECYNSNELKKKISQEGNSLQEGKDNF